MSRSAGRSIEHLSWSGPCITQQSDNSLGQSILLPATGRNITSTGFNLWTDSVFGNTMPKGGRSVHVFEVASRLNHHFGVYDPGTASARSLLPYDLPNSGSMTIGQCWFEIYANSGSIGGSASGAQGVNPHLYTGTSAISSIGRLCYRGEFLERSPVDFWFQPGETIISLVRWAGFKYLNSESRWFASCAVQMAYEQQA